MKQIDGAILIWILSAENSIKGLINFGLHFMSGIWGFDRE